MISYNDLYEILRKEKYSESLQNLPKDFIKDMSDYLSDKKLESSSDDDLFGDNVAKSKKQLENSVALFKELIRMRKKKLLNLVFVATETGIMKRDYENMLEHEREVFDSLVKAFEQGDKGLGKMMAGKKEEKKLRMVMFNQGVEQFVDSEGKLVGPFASGELANLDLVIAELFVSGGKAGYVDEN
jgi:DNA replication initiation complex subunit (GINS family)